MKKYIIISIAIICLLMTSCKKDNSSASSTPQGSIYGIVTDFASGDYVKHANVQLRPSGETTQTGYNGQYEFKNIEDGDYTIVVRKAEYTELIDDYVISVKNGRRMRRDVQIQKLPQMLQIVDNYQQPLYELDFGSYAGVSQKSFNLFNGGLVNLNYTITKTANWITQINPSYGTVNKGDMVAVSVIINRNLLSDGDNVTTIVVSTNAGGVELTIKARKSGGSINDLVVEVPGTNLMVQRADLGCYDWYSASAYCQSSNVANYNDWRLPTIDELEVLYNHREFISGFDGDSYWSSTQSYSIGTYNYYRFISSGTWGFVGIHSGSASDLHYVRAVRTTTGGGGSGSDALLSYDDGNGIDALGFTNGGTIYWANMFPSSMLSQYAGTSIVEIEALLNLAGTYTLQIYTGGTSSPGSLVSTINYNNNSSDLGWYNIPLPNAIPLNTSQNLWIVLRKTHSAGEYPAGVCADSGNPNGRWISDGDGTWEDLEQQLSYTWGIHTYVSNQKEAYPLRKNKIISAQIKGTEIPKP